MSDGTLERVRLAFERDFAQIPNEWLRDNSISLRARGLLALLMSHKEGYTVTHKSLAATNPEGVTAIEGAVKELRAARYLTIKKNRGRGGRIESWTWTLTDPAVEKARSGPQLDIPELAEPDLAQPDTANRHLKEAQLQEHSLTTVNGTSSSTRAGAKKDALTGDDHAVAPESVEQRYSRLIHQPCPYRRDRKEHDFATGTCPHCGISSSHRWVRGEVVRIDELESVGGNA